MGEDCDRPFFFEDRQAWCSREHSLAPHLSVLLFN